MTDLTTIPGIDEIQRHAHPIIPGIIQTIIHFDSGARASIIERGAAPQMAEVDEGKEQESHTLLALTGIAPEELTNSLLRDTMYEVAILNPVGDWDGQDVTRFDSSDELIQALKQLAR